MFNLYKSRRYGGLTTLPERVLKVLVHGPCGDSAAGAVPEVVTIACPAVGFRGVCGDCCDGRILSHGREGKEANKSGSLEVGRSLAQVTHWATKSDFEMKVSRKVGCVVTSNEIRFVSLANNFTV